MKPTGCSYSDHCDKGQVCAKFEAVDGTHDYEYRFCGIVKCKKDKDCTELDHPQRKYKPGKCEKEKCRYDFYNYPTRF
jgi:hypothetical protein